MRCLRSSSQLEDSAQVCPRLIREATEGLLRSLVNCSRRDSALSQATRHSNYRKQFRLLFSVTAIEVWILGVAENY